MTLTPETLRRCWEPDRAVCEDALNAAADAWGMDRQHEALWRETVEKQGVELLRQDTELALFRKRLEADMNTPTPDELRLLKNGDNEFDAEIDAAADAWEKAIEDRGYWKSIAVDWEQKSVLHMARIEVLEKENGWMRRVLHGILWPYWMMWVEGPWHATGDPDELAFFRAMKIEEMRAALAGKE